ncbi:MAG: hypothetical protein LBL98_06600 [Ruminococcus sp.]|jgi:hypothetical protein|nr:hypothetical protein [Ruminococcus sp.]
MPNITITRNNNPIAIKKPGIIITGKGRNAIRSELAGTGLTFRASILEEFNENISRLIIVANDDCKEALKYAFLAEERKIPHLLITTSVSGKFAVRFLHIMYTDEESLQSAIVAAVDAAAEIFSAPESYFLHSEAEGEYRFEQVLGDIFDRLPNFDFEKLFLNISAHPSDNFSCEFLQKKLPHLAVKRVDTDKLHRISAEIIGF